MKLRNKTLTTSAVATLATFGLLVGAASAQNTPPTKGPGPATDTTPHPAHMAGRIQKVDVAANSLTIDTRKGSVTVNVSSQTWVVAEKSGKCAEATLGDLKADQVVTVAGMTTTTANQIEARTIVQGKCAAKAAVGADKRGGGAHKGQMGKGVMVKHMAMGTIKSISGGTITLTSERGDDVTVTTTAGTVVLNGGFKDVASLKVGDKVQVLGRPVAPATKPSEKPATKPSEKPATKPSEKPATKPTRSIEAWGLRVVRDGAQLVVGRVERVDGNTITLKTREAKNNPGGLTVTLDGNTAYKSAVMMERNISLTNAVQADVKVGTTLMVEGVPSADGKSIAARAVVLMPSPQERKPKQ